MFNGPVLSFDSACYSCIAPNFCVARAACPPMFAPVACFHFWLNRTEAYDKMFVEQKKSGVFDLSPLRASLLSVWVNCGGGAPLRAGLTHATTPHGAGEPPPGTEVGAASPIRRVPRRPDGTAVTPSARFLAGFRNKAHTAPFSPAGLPRPQLLSKIAKEECPSLLYISRFFPGTFYIVNNAESPRRSSSEPTASSTAFPA